MILCMIFKLRKPSNLNQEILSHAHNIILTKTISYKMIIINYIMTMLIVYHWLINHQFIKMILKSQDLELMSHYVIGQTQIAKI